MRRGIFSKVIKEAFVLFKREREGESREGVVGELVRR